MEQPALSRKSSSASSSERRRPDDPGSERSRSADESQKDRKTEMAAILASTEPLTTAPRDPIGRLFVTLASSSQDAKFFGLEKGAASGATLRCTFLSDDGREYAQTQKRLTKAIVDWSFTFHIQILSFGDLNVHVELEQWLPEVAQFGGLGQLAGTLLTGVLTIPARVIEEEGGRGDVVVHLGEKRKAFASSTFRWEYSPYPNPYARLHQKLLDPAFLKDLIAITQPPIPHFVSSLVFFFISNGKGLDLWRMAVEYDVQHTTDMPQLFRGSALSTLILSEFLTLHGRAFLRETLHPLVRSVLAKIPDVELDPTKWAKPLSDKEVKQTEKRLAELCDGFLKGIASAMPRCPAVIREALGIVQAVIEADKRFVARSHFAFGGLLFLRFFCPAIAIPEHICPDQECTPAARRVLVLVAKVLQTVVNEVNFGAKEGFLLPMNALILNAHKSYSVDLYKKIMADKKKVFDKQPLRRRPPPWAYRCMFEWISTLPLLLPEADAEAIRQAVAEDEEARRQKAKLKGTSGELNLQSSTSSITESVSQELASSPKRNSMRRSSPGVPPERAVSDVSEKSKSSSSDSSRPQGGGAP